MAMVSLELSDEDKLDQMHPAISATPDYPYGTRISLTHRELDKFGLEGGDFKVGEIVLIKAMARVTSVSSDSTDMGPCDRVEFQLEEMALVGAGDDDDDE